MIRLQAPRPDGELARATRGYRCLVPAFDGAISSRKWKDALSAKFYAGAPTRQRQFRGDYQWSAVSPPPHRRSTVLSPPRQAAKTDWNGCPYPLAASRTKLRADFNSDARWARRTPSGSGSAIFRSSTRRLRDEWFEQVETSREEWEEKGPMGEGESACKVRHNNARHAGKNWDETCPCDAPAISPKSQRPVIHNQSESYS